LKRFLVSGAGGFIGAAIVEHLEKGGAEVVAISRSPRAQTGATGTRWLNFDLLQIREAALEKLLADAAPECCIHAAWYTNHADYLVHEVNREWIDASLRLEGAFRAAGGTRFIGLGTCLEYDLRGRTTPCVEGETPIAPETLYARCKAELFDRLMKRSPDMAWARVFFVYGPGDRDGRLVPWMLSQFARGEPAEPSFGGLRRDYVHVEDLAGQIVAIARSGARGAVNTGSGTAPTLSEIFAAGAEAVGRPDLARSNDRTGDQPPMIAADLSRFREEVGQPDSRPIDVGLRDTIEAL
jgi:nucleoside-diphosphate-sugar epimerase